jgi:hypothetical protein
MATPENFKTLHFIGIPLQGTEIQGFFSIAWPQKKLCIASKCA